MLLLALQKKRFGRYSRTKRTVKAGFYCGLRRLYMDKKDNLLLGHLGPWIPSWLGKRAEEYSQYSISLAIDCLGKLLQLHCGGAGPEICGFYFVLSLFFCRAWHCIGTMWKTQEEGQKRRRPPSEAAWPLSGCYCHAMLLALLLLGHPVLAPLFVASRHKITVAAW